MRVVPTTLLLALPLAAMAFKPKLEKTKKTLLNKTKEQTKTKTKKTLLNLDTMRSSVLFEQLRDNAETNLLKSNTVLNPFAVEQASVKVEVTSIGDIPVATVIDGNTGRPMNIPGSLRWEEANATLVGLTTKQERKYFLAQEVFREQWAKTKMSALLKFVKHTAAHEPERIVVVTDGGDVLYGGCSEKQMMQIYNAIIQASGNATVVAGAEVSPYPMHFMQFYNQSTRADLMDIQREVTRALDVKDDWAVDYADCRDKLGGPCDESPTYRFLNSGFLMGPAHDVSEMIQDIYKTGGAEEIAAQAYFLRNPNKVTLDYAGALSLSMHNLAEDEQSPISVHKTFLGKKQLHNKVTGLTQCFVHGNGNSEEFLNRLAIQMKAKD